MLFVVYINDRQDEIVNFTQMFTDDTKLYASVKNTEDSRFLQNDVNRLQEWAKIWQIRFNATKYKVMQLDRENMHFPYHMIHNSEQITLEETSVEKDLEFMWTRIWTSTITYNKLVQHTYNIHTTR